MNRVYDKDLQSLWKTWNDDMLDIRDNQKHSVGNINRFIMLNYACLIINRLRQNLKSTKGKYYKPEELVSHFSRMNWKYYSFSGQAFEDEELVKVLSGWYVDNDRKMSKKEERNVVGLLLNQTYFLEEASRMIIDVFEEW